MGFLFARPSPLRKYAERGRNRSAFVHNQTGCLSGTTHAFTRNGCRRDQRVPARGLGSLARLLTSVHHPYEANPPGVVLFGVVLPRLATLASSAKDAARDCSDLGGAVGQRCLLSSIQHVTVNGPTSFTSSVQSGLDSGRRVLELVLTS